MSDEQQGGETPEVPEGHLAFNVRFLVPERFARPFALSLQTGTCIQTQRTTFMRPTGEPAPLEHLTRELDAQEEPEGS